MDIWDMPEKNEGNRVVLCNKVGMFHAMTSFKETWSKIYAY
jgi:hypothetical protein